MYVEKYFAEHYSTNGIKYHVSFLKDGFVGTTEQLKLGTSGIIIDHDLKDWNDNLVLLTAKLKIIDDASNWYHYEDLKTLENKEFMLKVDASYGTENITLFNGWVNSSPVSQKYLTKSSINLTASNFISKLDQLYPQIILSGDPSNNDARSFIDIIDQTLRLTGKTDDITINSTLEPSSGIISSTKTLYNTCGINPQIFWKNNNQYDGGTEILEAILKPFNGYLYWWDNKWYIERYRDLFPADGSKGFVTYTSGQTYTNASSGTANHIIDLSLNIPSLECDGSIKFTGGSQTMQMIPGLEFLEITLNEQELINMTINDFSEITGGSFPSVHYPNYRKWNATRFIKSGVTGWDFPGYKTAGLFDLSTGYSFETSYQMYWTSDSSSIGSWVMKPGKPYHGIQNSILRWGWPQYYVNNVYNTGDPQYAGLSTRIKATITNEETKLNIKWKFSPIAAGSGGVNTWDYKCYYTLRVPTGSYWLTYVEDGDYWKYHNSNTFANYANSVEVNGSDLDESGTTEISVEIPIGDVSGWVTSGDKDIIFSILGDVIKKNTSSTWTTSSTLMAAYGDVFITGNSGIDPENNKIIAQLNKNVLTTEKVDFKIYDTNSLMLDNGILTGSNYLKRTNYWNEHGQTTYRSLVNWYIHDKYQLFNRNRRELSGEIKYPGYLKPMSQWYDPADPSIRKYILTSYSYDIGDDSYNCTWIEYDNSSTINLNIVS